MDELDQVKFDLHCSETNAWFRGHSNNNWKLYPSIMRGYVEEKSSPKSIDKSLEIDVLSKEILIDKLKRLISDAPTTLNFGKKDFQSYSSLVRKLEDAKSELESVKLLRKKFNIIRGEIEKSSQRNYVPELPLDEIHQICKDCSIPIIMNLSGEQFDIRKQINVADTNKVGNLLKERKIDIENKIKTITDNLKKKIYVPPGERDAFVEFKFRWREPFNSSWDALARMRHYGVSTRLLDWTESSAVALWFALEHYIKLYEKIRRSNTGKSPKIVMAEALQQCRKFDEPCLWVLNPYELARQAAEQDRIFDLSLDKDLDYFQRFHNGTWPFQKPIPAYAPWVDQRIAAQRGTFTIQGCSLMDLEAQTTQITQSRHVQIPLEPAKYNKALRKIVINRKAACIGAGRLVNLGFLDQYVMFRDMDSFGKIINKRFIE